MKFTKNPLYLFIGALALGFVGLVAYLPLEPVFLSGWIELLSPISPDPEQAALWLESLSLAIRPVQTIVLLVLLLLLLIVIPAVTAKTADELAAELSGGCVA